MSLSEKTRTSNHLQMSLQRQHVLLCYFKTLRVWSGLELAPGTSPEQSSTIPTELTDRREMNFKKQEMKLTRIKQSYGQRSFIFGAASLWNRLPAELKDCSLK